MKTIACALLALAFALPVHADNLIQNGDFSDGLTHWHGDIRAPADFASDPLSKPDPFLSKGMIIPLKHGKWAKVQQDFKGKFSGGQLDITYMLSSDIAFSDKAEDYKNIPMQIDFTAWKPFNIPPDSWLMFLSDFGSATGLYNHFTPKLGSTAPQTLSVPIKGLTPFENKTITFAFPPGKGMVVILSVSLTGN